MTRSTDLTTPPDAAPADLAAVCERLDTLNARLEHLAAAIERTAPPPAATAADQLLDAAGLARALGVSIRTIRTKDAAGELPKPVTIGRCRRWRLADVGAPSR